VDPAPQISRRLFEELRTEVKTRRRSMLRMATTVMLACFAIMLEAGGGA